MTPTETQIAEAMRIVANPDRHPSYRRQDAWLLLKEARGQRVRAATLPGFPAPVAPVAPAPEGWPMSEPCRERMWEQARRNGIGLHLTPEGAA